MIALEVRVGWRQVWPGARAALCLAQFAFDGHPVVAGEHHVHALVGRGPPGSRRDTPTRVEEQPRSIAAAPRQTGRAADRPRRGRSANHPSLLWNLRLARCSAPGLASWSCCGTTGGAYRLGWPSISRRFRPARPPASPTHSDAACSLRRPEAACHRVDTEGQRGRQRPRSPRCDSARTVRGAQRHSSSADTVPTAWPCDPRRARWSCWPAFWLDCSMPQVSVICLDRLSVPEADLLRCSPWGVSMQ